MTDIRSYFVLTFCFLTFTAVFPSVSYMNAGDWPTWRHDASRSGATNESLPSHLALLWTRQSPRLSPAWQEDPRLHYDAVYEPIVSNGLMYKASSRNDSISAYDIHTGVERWRFIAGGPIRFAPISNDGLLFFGADDGCFYCLDQSDGSLTWKFQVAPNNRRVIGNGRMISVWPIRGGAVLKNGSIWFTAGVWSFEGTFLCSFDVGSAREAASSLAGSDYTLTHLRNSKLRNVTIETLDGLTPQGYLAATDERLIVPCGRSNVAIREFANPSKSLVVPKYSTHGATNYHVSGTGRFLFHGSMNFDLEASKEIQPGAGYPVFADGVMYFGKSGVLSAQSLAAPKTVVRKDRRGNDIGELEFQSLWNITNQQVYDVPPEASDPKWFTEWLATNPLQIDLKAGQRLYGHQGKRLFAVELSEAGNAPTIVWNKEIDGVARSMIAADGKLIVVTVEGIIYCFGSEAEFPELAAPAVHHQDDVSTPQPTVVMSAVTESILKEEEFRAGYCLVLGAGSGILALDLLRHSDLQMVLVEPDPIVTKELRERLDREGVYGTRIAIIQESLETAGLPPYFANLVVSEDFSSFSDLAQNRTLQAVYKSTRPYGGSWRFALTDEQHVALKENIATAQLVNADLKRIDGLSCVTRVGSLPGAANWTHEYGDASNTLMSHDELVRTPLGILWFGGPSANGELFYNRHFWPPGMAVVDGRMFIQGPGKLTAVDVYTGRIMWQRSLEDKEGYRPGRRGNDFEDQLSGFHFLAVEDSVYLVMVDRCVRIDPGNGRTLAEFRFEDPGDKWGSVQVEGDMIIAELFRQTEKFGLMPVEIVALNRQTGQKQWSRKAELSFPMHAISGDRVYCFDGALEDFYRDWKRKGLLPKASEQKHIVAFDLRTGKEVWRVPAEKTITWLSFSREHNILMASSKNGMAAYFGDDGYQLWEKQADAEGFKGHPENLWDKIILWKDQILDQRGPGRAYNIQTGLPIQRQHPITKDQVEWEFTKTGHHCNYAIANPHMMTFRADSAGFCNIDGATTGRLEGFRSGCRNSLIPANGVLNAPNFAEGCICGYPLFTSLSLVHLPTAENWSYSALRVDPAKDGIKQLGINFGAPGDRLDDVGVYWVGYPSRVSSSPGIGITLSGQLEYFRHHVSLSNVHISDDDPNVNAATSDLNWIYSSGVEGVSQLKIAIGPGNERKFTVELLFATPHDVENIGERVFHIAIQGQERLRDFDIAAERANQARESDKETTNSLIKKVFHGIVAKDAIEISFTAVNRQPVLCGLQLTLEEPLGAD
jgi:outer membrane protein assembly factor BamB